MVDRIKETRSIKYPKLFQDSESQTQLGYRGTDQEQLYICNTKTHAPHYMNMTASQTNLRYAPLPYNSRKEDAAPVRCWRYVQDENPLRKEAVLPSYFRMIKKIRAQVEKSAKCPRPKTPEPERIDPILDFLRFIKLPVIWIIGLPNNQTIACQQKLLTEIVERYNYSLIDLDIWIAKWKTRAKLHPTMLEPKLTTSNIVNLELDQEVYKALQDGGMMEFPEIVLPKSNCRLNLRRTIELLKFAMIESLPTNGFLIVNFPFNETDALVFEQTFYEVSVGIHIARKMKPNEKYTKFSYFQNMDQYIFPKLCRRTIDFVVREAEDLTKAYGKKFIRIPLTERFSISKVATLVRILLDKNLRKTYPQSFEKSLRGFSPEDLQIMCSSSSPETTALDDDDEFRSGTASSTPRTIELEKLESRNSTPISIRASSSFLSTSSSGTSPRDRGDYIETVKTSPARSQKSRLDKKRDKKQYAHGDYSRDPFQSRMGDVHKPSSVSSSNSSSSNWSTLDSDMTENLEDMYHTTNSDYGNYYSDPILSSISRRRSERNCKYSSSSSMPGFHAYLSNPT